MPAFIPLKERIERLSIPEPNTGCWLFLGALNDKGYGLLQVGKRQLVAHRAYFELQHGPVPANQHLDHLCRVRSCVNPRHLEPVTPRENVLRGTGLAAVNAKKTHCKHGHAFDAANTLVGDGGRRRWCRKCDADKHARKRLSSTQESPQ